MAKCLDIPVTDECLSEIKEWKTTKATYEIGAEPVAGEPISSMRKAPPKYCSSILRYVTMCGVVTERLEKE